MFGDYIRGLTTPSNGFEGISWRQMAAAGNVYRHDYEDVAAQFVWDTVQQALPPLKVIIEQELV